jgi:subtilisin
MSDAIRQELQTTGVASVICILKSPARASAAARTARDISKYFVSSDMSHESALVTAATTGSASGRRRPSRRRSPTAKKAAAERVGAAARFRARPAVYEMPILETEPPPLVRYYPNLGVALGTVTREGLAAARADNQIDKVVGTPQLELIRPERVRAASARGQQTWGIHRLGIPSLWDQGLTGKGVLVGHLDTGVDGTHPALRRAIASFAEFDSLGRQVVPNPDPRDSDDHGTHTAATIAARSVDGHHVGVAPGAKLASAIVIEGGQIVARVLGGMDWTVAQGVRVLNMSLGLPGWVDDFLPIMQIVRERGVLPVFAVGNEGPGTSRSPGNYTESLSVGAFDRGEQLAWFSSSQRFKRKEDPTVPDLVAPGVGVISARPGGGFQAMDGTSMATPHIAGLVALLLEAKPAATVSEVEHAIFASCARAPDWPPERSGRGCPNGPHALEVLLSSTEGDNGGVESERQHA